MIKIPRQQAQPGNSRRKQFFILVGWTLDIHHDKSLNIQAVLVARTVSHKKSLICVISRSIRKTYIILVRIVFYWPITIIMSFLPALLHAIFIKSSLAAGSNL
jgi:hypothetical protein